jgi:hypothetical protein
MTLISFIQPGQSLCESIKGQEKKYVFLKGEVFFLLIHPLMGSFFSLAVLCLKDGENFSQRLKNMVFYRQIICKIL